MKNEKSKIESIEVGEFGNRKLRAFSVLVVFLLVGGLYLVYSGGDDVPDGYAEASDGTVHDTGVEASASFNISGSGVTPASHEVELGDSVAFSNLRDSMVEVSFDRSNRSIEIRPESSRTLLINGITYFEVNGENYSAQGRVNVQ